MPSRINPFLNEITFYFQIYKDQPGYINCNFWSVFTVEKSVSLGMDSADIRPSGYARLRRTWGRKYIRNINYIVLFFLDIIIFMSDWSRKMWNLLKINAEVVLVLSIDDPDYKTCWTIFLTIFLCEYMILFIYEKLLN